MGQAIPQRHPAVVLRTHYDLVRALLAVTLVTVVCLAVAVAVIVADDAGSGTTSAGGRAQPAGLQASQRPPDAATPRTSAGFTRFDAGREQSLLDGQRSPVADHALRRRPGGGHPRRRRDAVADQPLRRRPGGGVRRTLTPRERQARGGRPRGRPLPRVQAGLDRPACVGLVSAK